MYLSGNKQEHRIEVAMVNVTGAIGLQVIYYF